MKRIIGAAIAGVVAFSGIYGLAASLNLGTAPTLGAAAQTVAACTSDTLSVTFPTPTYSAADPGYTVASVTVTDTTATPTMATTCTGHAWSVTAENSSHVALGTVTGTVGANNFTATFSPAVDAAAVSYVAVSIA